MCVCAVKVPLEARRFGSPEAAVTGGFKLANTIQMLGVEAGGQLCGVSSPTPLHRFGAWSSGPQACIASDFTF